MQHNINERLGMPQQTAQYNYQNKHQTQHAWKVSWNALDFVRLTKKSFRVGYDFHI